MFKYLAGAGAALVALSVSAHGATRPEPQKVAPKSVVIVVPERTQTSGVLRSQFGRVMTPLEWKKMAAGLDEVSHLKAGMTRGDVLQHFHPLTNEIYSVNHRRYWLDDYPDLIVVLDFKTRLPVSRDPHAFLNPEAYRLADHSGYVTDVLAGVKVYYAGPALEKQHTVVL